MEGSKDKERGRKGEEERIRKGGGMEGRKDEERGRNGRKKG